MYGLERMPLNKEEERKEEMKKSNKEKSRKLEVVPWKDQYNKF